ncbi:hypothetical protein GW17_00022765 [Ensete ventricosum]|nr:hypothetical protein GW17_00022765 [Ensete ventricosum]RZR83666.1 hypothetical protein BHM03_00010342 [Ensete ventricosum]
MRCGVLLLTSLWFVSIQQTMSDTGRCSESQFLPPMATAAAVRWHHYGQPQPPAPSPSPILCFIRRGQVRLHATVIRLYLSRFTLLCQAIAAPTASRSGPAGTEAGPRSVANPNKRFPVFNPSWSVR